MKLFKKPNKSKFKVNFSDWGFPLGKRPALRDSRNIKFKNILKDIPLPEVPEDYDFDVVYKQYSIPTPMFANDQYGNCVIAGRAHQTLRFELFEQKKILPITDSHVIDEYWDQSGGKGPQYDNGLVVLHSLSQWRNKGWRIGCHKYNIHAFAQINPKSQKEVKEAIYFMTGVGVGLMLPTSAKNQFHKNERWGLVEGNSGDYGSWGGHYVYINGYTKEGPICVTWGKYQHMTWEFFYNYCDEAYAIIDSKNQFTEDSPVDINKLEEYLNQIA